MLQRRGASEHSTSRIPHCLQADVPTAPGASYHTAAAAYSSQRAAARDQNPRRRSGSTGRIAPMNAPDDCGADGCAICLGPYRAPTIITCCGHTFCRGCLLALPAPKRCPICRAGPFDQSQMVRNYSMETQGEAGPRRASWPQADPIADLWGGDVATPPPGRSPKGAAVGRRPDAWAAPPAPLVSPTAANYSRAGAPAGMAHMLAKEDADIAVRVFLLDNSGSTSQGDGHVVIERQGTGSYYSCPSTRWEEIKSIARDQANWNAAAGVRCEFMLLNPPVPFNPEQGRDFCIVDPAAAIAPQLDALQQMLDRNGPRGTTPLAARMAQLRERLRHTYGTARIMLSIVTDGVPTDENNGKSQPRNKSEFIQELRQFGSTLNSFVVIRLATDEDEVLEFFNEVDDEVELPLDILDDLKGEAVEIYQKGNGWFAYTPMIHRIREGGTTNKLFDLLDERAFTVPEIATFLEYILKDPQDAPFPREPEELIRVVQAHLKVAPNVYDGRLGTMTAPVNVKLLTKTLRSVARRQKVSRLSSYLRNFLR